MLKRLLALVFAVTVASLLAACNTNGGIPAGPENPAPGQATPGGQPTPAATPPNTADGRTHHALSHARHLHAQFRHTP